MLDQIQVKLSDMKVFSAIRTEPTEKFEIGYEQQGSEMMTESCMLELTIERNLEWAFGRQGIVLFLKKGVSLHLPQQGFVPIP